MLHVNVEQRMNLKFCVKIGTSTTETYDSLKRDYEDKSLSCSTQVFERFKRFKGGYARF